MKVGAGGLQSQVMFELDQVRKEGLLRTEHQVRTGEVPELNRNIPEGERLVRFVEQLNTAAALANYPYRLRAERAKDRVRIYRYLEEDQKQGEEEVSPEDLLKVWRKLQQDTLLDESI
ncbi:MAG: hypothetical protein AB1374_06725 [Bacillota bacterium]